MEKYFYPHHGKYPTVENNVAFFPGSRAIGAVSLASGVSVWYNAVLRADTDSITIGQYSNIQDCCVIHCDYFMPCQIGDYVTIGHQAVLHSCTIKDYCLIGMGSIILNGAEIGEGAIIGAGSVVTAGTIIPPYSVAVGSPAKVIKTLPPASIAERKAQAMEYFNLAQEQLKDLAL